MNSNNAEHEMRSHSHHSSHSKCYQQMPTCPMPMPSYHPCMYCPMMYGNMGMQKGQMMYGDMDMQDDQMMYGDMGMQDDGQMMYGDGMSMPQYGEDSREEDENRSHAHYYGHPIYYGHPYYPLYPYHHGYYHYHR